MPESLSPALRFSRRVLFDSTSWLVCAQIAELVVVLSTDDNLHPYRPTRQVAEPTGRLLDTLLSAAGPAVALLLLVLGLGMGPFGEKLLAVLGTAVGAALIYVTVGPQAVGIYFLCVVLLRVAATAPHKLLNRPLRLLLTIIVVTALLHVVVR